MAISVVKDKYNQILEFFQFWIPEILPGTNYYLAGQSAPRPENPYVGFNPMAEIDRIGRDERRVKSSGEEILRGQRIISCDVFGYSDSTSRYDGSDTAWAMLQELRFSLGYPEIEERLCSIACRVLDEGNIQENSETLNVTNEPRAIWRFVLSTAICQTQDSGAIETVNAEGKFIAPSSNEIDVEISVTKP